jgi:hypothetical protein
MLIEMWKSGGQPDPRTLTITVALWALSVGITSKNMLAFGLGIVMGFFFAVDFVVAAAGGYTYVTATQTSVGQSATTNWVTVQGTLTNFTFTNIEQLFGTLNIVTNNSLTNSTTSTPEKPANQITIVSEKAQVLPHTVEAGYVAIVLLLFLNMAERYDRHVKDGEPFLQFGGQGTSTSA